MEALQVAGVGNKMRLWEHIIYNGQDSMWRRILVNGRLSREFSIRAGVAQGCPLSLLLFLFVAEVLSRRIINDVNNAQGIEI